MPGNAPTVEKYYRLMINGWNVFDQSVEDDIRTFNNI